MWFRVHTIAERALSCEILRHRTIDNGFFMIAFDDNIAAPAHKFDALIRICTVPNDIAKTNNLIDRLFDR